jgi:hypothetical protein
LDIFLLELINWQRLALPYLKESLYFPTAHKYHDLTSKLAIDPALRSQVRTLYFHTNMAIDLRPIFGVHLVNIIGLAPVSVTLKAFSDLVKNCGATLVRLEGINVTKASTKPGDPAIFSHLTNIRSLSLGFKTPFASSTSIPSSTLATLKQLKLTNFDPSLMTVLSQMKCA